MYDNEEEIKRKRRTLIYVSVGLVVVILIVLLMLLSKGSGKKPIAKEKLTCELEVIKGTLGADGVYSTEIEVGFKEIKPDKDITKKTVGERDLPRNTSTYIVNTEGSFKVNGYVQNVTGDVATCTIEVKVRPTKPTCELEVKAGTMGTDDWYTSDVEVGFKLANSNNPNTKISSYYIKEYVEGEDENQLIQNTDKYILKDNKEVQLVGYVKDTNGAEGVCGLKVKKDSALPTCKLSVESGRKNDKGEYIDNPVIVIELADDLQSGLLKKGIGIDKNYEAEKYTVTKEGTTKVSGYVQDKAGNEGVCSLDVKKEVNTVAPPPKTSNPTCTLSVSGTKSGNSYLNSATVKIAVATTNGATVTDKGVGLDKSYNNQSSYVVNRDGNTTVWGVVKDSYGNSSSCSVQVSVTSGALLSSKVQVGDKVAYDAGLWSSTVEVPRTNGKFGGYTAGQSKNNSVSCFYQDSNTRKNGWVVLAVKSGIVYLVHAGTPECYFHGYGSSATNSINLMAARTRGYVNTVYADSATILICGDNQMNCQDGATAPEIHKTGSHYYLASVKSEKILWGVSATGRVTGNSDRAQGIRPIVSLKTAIKTTGKNSEGAWVLVNPSTRTGTPEVKKSIFDSVRTMFDLFY